MCGVLMTESTECIQSSNTCTAWRSRASATLAERAASIAATQTDQLRTQHGSTAASVHRRLEKQQRQRVAGSLADVADVDVDAAHLSSHRVGSDRGSNVCCGSDIGLAVDGRGRDESSS